MMLDMKTTEFLEVLSSSEPVPSGGGACAAVGAFASALGMMVANLTVGKKKYKDVEEEIKVVRAELLILRNKLEELTDRDAQGFEPLSKAYKLPKNTEEERQEKAKVMERALAEACVVPMEIMETSLQVMELLEVLGKKGTRLAISDVGVGVLFAQAALEGSRVNVFINTNMMNNIERAQAMNKKADELVARGSKLKEKIYQEVLDCIR